MKIIKISLLENIAMITVCCAILSFVFVIFFTGITKNEVNTCQRLLSYSQNNDKFYVTSYQNDMCRYHGIDLSQLLLEQAE